MADICCVPENYPVYMAFIDKAQELAGAFPLKAHIFRTAAETVSKWDSNLFADWEKYGSLLHLPRTAQDFLHNFLLSYNEQQA